MEMDPDRSLSTRTRSFTRRWFYSAVLLALIALTITGLWSALRATSSPSQNTEIWIQLSPSRSPTDSPAFSGMTLTPCSAPEDIGRIPPRYC